MDWYEESILHNKLLNNIKKFLSYIFENILPLYALIPTITCFIWNSIVYWGTRVINGGMKHFDMTLEIDRMTPVVPSFIIIYFGCYISWVIFYIMSVRTDKMQCAKFIAFDLMTRTVCGIIFIILPTCNIRPEIYGDDIFSKALGFLYSIDAADNLFPSIHCLVSWNCFVGIRDIKEYGGNCKVISVIMAVIVFVSTLVTKQHVIADVISAVVISEICWWVVGHTQFDKKIWCVFEKLNNMFFGKIIKEKGNLF